jgi:RNA polymerase sigma factor (sigma-70 family)
MKSLNEEYARELPDAAPRADEVLGDAEGAEQLRDAVLKLPEDLRFTVTAHFWGGLEVKEIAAIEEITTVAIRKRLHKAFSLLEEALGGNVEEERQ